MIVKELWIWVLVCTLVCHSGYCGVGSSKSKTSIADHRKVKDIKSIQVVTKAVDTKVVETKTKEIKVEETKVEETKVEETKVEETRLEKKTKLELSDKELLRREYAQNEACMQMLKAMRGGVDSVLKKYLTAQANEYLRMTCANMSYQMKKSPKERAQDDIRKMVGELKWVEPGKFIMGSEVREPNALGYNQRPHYVEIKEGYWLPVDEITVANYHYVMTGEWISKEKQMVEAKMKEQENTREGEIKTKNNQKKARRSSYPDIEFLLQNEKKPMSRLSKSEWDKFTKKLNEKIANLWPIAYRDLYEKHGNRVPVFDRPEDFELEFATTIPLEQEVEVNNPAHKADKNAPAKVKITATHSLFSGIDRKVKFDKSGRLDKATEDYNEISQYVVCQRNWEDGPSDVDSVLPNVRGFRSLSGNIWKQTKTRLNFGSVYCSVLVGGCWYSEAGNARSAARTWLNVYEKWNVGFLPRAVPK